MLNVHVAGMSMSEQGGDTIESGGGGGFRVGWGLTRHVTLFVGADYGTIETEAPNLDGDYRVTFGDVGLLYNFRDGKALRPYFEGALTSRTLKATYTDTITTPTFEVRRVDIDTEGMAFTFGGGLNYYFTPIWALNVGLNWSVGRFRDFDIGGERAEDTAFSASGARFHFGLTLYPTKKSR